MSVLAPNIAGRSITGNSGDWKNPVAIVADLTTIANAGRLIDNDISTGTNAGQVVFDLGDSVDVSHIRLYTTNSSTFKWKVYGSNDLVEWTRILNGQAL